MHLEASQIGRASARGGTHHYQSCQDVTYQTTHCQNHHQALSGTRHLLPEEDASPSPLTHYSLSCLSPHPNRTTLSFIPNSIATKTTPPNHSALLPHPILRGALFCVFPMSPLCLCTLLPALPSSSVFYMIFHKK